MSRDQIALFSQCGAGASGPSGSCGRETLLVFTGGLVEARRGSYMFGSERIAELSTGTATCRPMRSPVLIDKVRSFYGHQLADDLALLVVKESPPTDLATLRSGHLDHDPLTLPRPTA